MLMEFEGSLWGKHVIMLGRCDVSFMSCALFLSWRYIYFSLMCHKSSNNIWLKQNLFIQRPHTLMGKNLENACGKLEAQVDYSLSAYYNHPELYKLKNVFLPKVFIYVASALRKKSKKVNTEPGKIPENFHPRWKIQLPSFIILFPYKAHGSYHTVLCAKHLRITSNWNYLHSMSSWQKQLYHIRGEWLIYDTD